MKILWLIVMVAVLGLTGCERSREKSKKQTGTERPGTVAPAPERPGTHEGTTPGETGTPGETSRERTAPGQPSGMETGTESTTPGATERHPSEGATTAPSGE